MGNVEEFVVKINHNVAELKEKFEVASSAAEQLGDALDDINNCKLKMWQEETDDYETAFHSFDTSQTIDYYSAEALVKRLSKESVPVFSPEKDMVFFYGKDTPELKTYRVWIKVPELEVHGIQTLDGKVIYQ